MQFSDCEDVRMLGVHVQGLVDEHSRKKMPMALPKFRASGQPLDRASSAQVSSSS